MGAAAGAIATLVPRSLRGETRAKDEPASPDGWERERERKKKQKKFAERNRSAVKSRRKIKWCRLAGRAECKMREHAKEKMHLERTNERTNTPHSADAGRSENFLLDSANYILRFSLRTG